MRELQQEGQADSLVRLFWDEEIGFFLVKKWENSWICSSTGEKGKVVHGRLLFKYGI